MSERDELLPDVVAERVSAAVDSWLRWLPRWAPGTHRGKSRMCRRCIGSPVLAAAGLAGDVPHQVVHALNSRMQRIIDRAVDDYTERQLPTLHAELTGEQIWNAGGFEPGAGLDPEFEGLDLDPESEDEQPFLFTMAELVEQTRPEPPLPRPPLTSDEKRRLREEIDLADRVAHSVGQQLCFALASHQPRIEAAIGRFVEPQIQALLDELTRQLQAPPQ